MEIAKLFTLNAKTKKKQKKDNCKAFAFQANAMTSNRKVASCISRTESLRCENNNFD